MLAGDGFYRGSSILVSGTAGTGKTSLAAHFAEAACRRGERCLYFAFEEAPAQILRNVASIGVQLAPWIDRGPLRIVASRPTAYGLEAHLAEIHHVLIDVKPQAVVIDPVSSLTNNGAWTDVQAMLTRLMDHLKGELITSFFTSLNATPTENTDIGISSIIDTWLLLRDVESNGERNRVIYILKSRGMAHSNQLREFRLTSRGAQLVPAYLGPEGMLTGSARLSQKARERAAALKRAEETERLERDLMRKREQLEAQIQDLRRTFASVEGELLQELRQRKAVDEQAGSDIREMSRARSSPSERQEPT
jgi:circadian clock protein KaiC